MADQEQPKKAGDSAAGEAGAKAPVTPGTPVTPVTPVEKAPWDVDPVAPSWQDEDSDPLVAALRKTHPDAIEWARSYAGDLAIKVKRESLGEVARSLKETHGFHYMTDIAGVDYVDQEPRFEVVYHVYNHSQKRRVRLRVATDEETPVPTVSGVWRGANWPEREVYDMYGVRFEGHPDMTRILLWEGFNGYPLRKDFPVEGIDTGAAIYPEYYQDEQGPVAGTGTGWKPPQPPKSPEPEAQDGGSGKAGTDP